ALLDETGTEPRSRQRSPATEDTDSVGNGIAVAVQDDPHFLLQGLLTQIGDGPDNPLVSVAHPLLDDAAHDAVVESLLWRAGVIDEEAELAACDVVAAAGKQNRLGSVPVADDFLHGSSETI